MLGLYQPISSPMMTRMLGLLACAFAADGSVMAKSRYREAGREVDKVA